MYPNTNRSINKFVLIFLVNAARYISHNPPAFSKAAQIHYSSLFKHAPCTWHLQNLSVPIRFFMCTLT